MIYENPIYGGKNMKSDKYLSLKSLAEKYDLHQDTIKRRLKEFDMQKNDHYIIIGGSIRYHAHKIHNLLISEEENQTVQEVLSRLMVS
jgi:hypothetical protein